MDNKTLEDLIREKNCRIGKFAGRDSGCKFWRPFAPVRLKRNAMNYNMVINAFSLEFRHFEDGEVQAILKFNDWMDEKYSKIWYIPEMLRCATAKDVASILRAGVPFGKNEEGELVYVSSLADDDGWENLQEELTLLSGGMIDWTEEGES